MSNNYVPYHPQQLEEWKSGDHESPLIYFAEKPLIYLSVFAVDLYMVEGFGVAEMEKLARELAWCEEVELDEVEKIADELFEGWNSGCFPNDDVFDLTARQLIREPAACIVCFLARLLTSKDTVSGLLQAGWLAGALNKAESQEANDGD